MPFDRSPEPPSLAAVGALGWAALLPSLFARTVRRRRPPAPFEAPAAQHLYGQAAPVAASRPLSAGRPAPATPWPDGRDLAAAPVIAPAAVAVVITTPPPDRLDRSEGAAS